MSDEQQRDDYQAADPWGLPSQDDPATTWPEEGAVPEDEADADRPARESPPEEEAEQEAEPAPEAESPPVEEEAGADRPAPAETTTVREAFQQVAEAPGSTPGSAVTEEEPPAAEGEGGEAETVDSPQAPPDHTTGWGEAEEAGPEETTTDAPHTSPFEESVGPLSQALAAAKNVISSLHDTPPDQDPAPAESTEEEPEGRAVAQESQANQPSSPPLEEEAALPVEEEAALPVEEEAALPVEEEPATDIPEEPPPWLQEDEDGGTTPAENQEPVVETTAAEPVAPQAPPDHTTGWGEAEEAVAEETTEDADQEEPPGQSSPELTDQEPQLTGHRSDAPEEEGGGEEEELVIEIDEDIDDEDLEQLAAQLAGYAGEGDEVVIEEDHIRLERAEPDEQEAEASPVDAEDESPVDTTPSAYAELASMAEEEPPDEEEPEEEPAASAEEGGPPADRSPIESPDAPSVEWGALWRESAQGWVEDEDGNPTWRPIVTTTPVLSDWEVDTYLGVVGGEVLVGAPGHTGGIRSLSGGGGSQERDLARARTAAVRAMVEDAVARGAHAVVGVEVTYAPVAAQVLVTASGTAVTLKTRS